MRVARHGGAALSPVLLAVLATSLVACGSAPKPPRDELGDLFRAAIADAMVVEPGEVVDDLTVLAEGEDGLPRRGGQVLVTTWAEERWLRRPGRRVIAETDLWVTPGRELAELCRRLDTSPFEQRLRLEQLLGLAPGDGRSRRMVELWVWPEDLFRPCVHPAVTAVRCDPDRVAPEEVPEAHRRWLEETARQYHRAPAAGGYPWTGLGYTFDWGDPYTEVGLTEWVIPAGAEVTVARVEPTGAYCEAR